MKISGSIHQDRNAGIMGVIGKASKTIPVALSYFSPFNEEMHYHFRLADDKSLNSTIPLLLCLSLYNSVEAARTGSGEFHSVLSGEIQLAGHDPIVLNNFYAGTNSGADIYLATLDVAINTSVLLMNKFNKPKIEKICEIT